MEKQWAIISEFPNYKISTDSEVVNIITGKYLSVHPHQHGHRVVRLWKNNTTRLMKIYRLKAIAFIPNPENKRDVNHLDGNRLNEDLSNLEWCTPKENMQHSFRTGLCRGHFEGGSKHVLRKVSLVDIHQIRLMRNFKMKLQQIGDIFGINMGTVCKICIHKQTIEYELEPK